MEQNPFAAMLRESEATIKSLRSEQDELRKDISWNDAFDRDKGERILSEQAADCESCMERKSQISDELVSAEVELDRLQYQARLTFNPGDWFSERRKSAKTALKLQKVQRDTLDLQHQSAVSALKIARRKRTKAKRDLERSEAFDRTQIENRLDRIPDDIALEELRRDDISARKDVLDSQLKSPLGDLSRLRADLAALTGRSSSLNLDLANLDSELAQVERLESDLSSASNSYERALIHQDCERRYGESRPRGVIRDLREQVNRLRGEKRAVASQIEITQRSIEKVENRIAAITKRGTRSISALIIDGNNLCYEGQTVIGLDALRPLCQLLSRSYNVTAVFDASIRRLLGENDEYLRHELKGVNVHVVAAGSMADETILELAVDELVFVISNDRYAEFQDMAAVREGRIIRHELVNGRIIIHDLFVNEPYISGARRSGD